jgi:hypothetical protein
MSTEEDTQVSLSVVSECGINASLDRARICLKNKAQRSSRRLSQRREMNA